MARFTNDPRTVILGDDGRFVTVGRHSTPTEDEIATAAAGLAAQGMGGWLATMSGTIHQRLCPSLTMLREIAPPRQAWDAAVASFQAAHKTR